MIVREKKHLIDWDNRNFPKINEDWSRRKIKEALYIDSINPQILIDLQKLMNSEKGTDISGCWKEFPNCIQKSLKQDRIMKEIQQLKLELSLGQTDIERLHKKQDFAYQKAWQNKKWKMGKLIQNKNKHV